MSWIGPTVPPVPTITILPAGTSTDVVAPLAVTTPLTTAIVVDPSLTSSAYSVPLTDAVVGRRLGLEAALGVGELRHAMIGVAIGLTAFDHLRGCLVTQDLERHERERRIEVETGEAPVEVFDRCSPIGTGSNGIAFAERRAIFSRLECAAACLHGNLPAKQAKRRELFGGGGSTGEDRTAPTKSNASTKTAVIEISRPRLVFSDKAQPLPRMGRFSRLHIPAASLLDVLFAIRRTVADQRPRPKDRHSPLTATNPRRTSARRRSSASISSSRSPSRTRSTSPISTSVRWSFTSRYGAST